MIEKTLVHKSWFRLMHFLAAFNRVVANDNYHSLLRWGVLNSLLFKTENSVSRESVATMAQDRNEP